MQGSDMKVNAILSADNRVRTRQEDLGTPDAKIPGLYGSYRDPRPETGKPVLEVLMNPDYQRRPNKSANHALAEFVTRKTSGL